MSKHKRGTDKMADNKSEESTVEEEVINAASEWVEDSSEPAKKGSKGWLSRSIVVSIWC
jgi:hypothetical protein